MAEETKPKFEIGVAPMPVADDEADTYGKGYLTGTIAGIAATSSKQNAAWELVKFMTTDTDAVVNFANAIHNVPSTLAALKSPKLKYDPRFKVFLDIAANPKSTTTPPSVNGGAYLTSLQNLGFDVEKARRRTSRRAWRRPRRKSTRRSPRRSRADAMSTYTLRSKRRRSALRAAAFMSPWLIGFCVFFAYPLISTVYFSFTSYDGFAAPPVQRLQELVVRLQRLPAVLAGAAQHPLARRRDGGLPGGLRTRCRAADHQDQDGYGRLPDAVLPALSGAARRRHARLRLPAQPRYRPVNSILGDLGGMGTPGWFTDATWSKPALTALAVWGGWAT